MVQHELVYILDQWTRLASNALPNIKHYHSLLDLNTWFSSLEGILTMFLLSQTLTETNLKNHLKGKTELEFTRGFCATA